MRYIHVIFLVEFCAFTCPRKSDIKNKRTILLRTGKFPDDDWAMLL